MICGKPRMLPKERAHSRLVLFRINFSVHDALLTQRSPNEADISVVASVDIGVAAVDGIAYRDGVAAVADQLNDQVLFFESTSTTSSRRLACFRGKAGI